jgi:hypothetical protein
VAAAGLIKEPDRALTGAGFRFLLMDTNGQAWTLLRDYIRSAEQASGQAARGGGGSAGCCFCAAYGSRMLVNVPACCLGTAFATINTSVLYSAPKPSTPLPDTLRLSAQRPSCRRC